MTLIDPAGLARLLESGDAPTVLDVTWRLGGPSGRQTYLDAHIPGATFLDLDEQLCGAPGPGGRHPLPDQGALELALRQAGVRASRPVVCYDGGDGLASARLWWTLRWAGHPRVSVLDGGFTAWRDAGMAAQTGEVVVEPGDFVVRGGGVPMLDAGSAASLPARGVLLDVRATPRYLGEFEPIDAVAGHIAGAVNLPVDELRAPSGRLHPPARLREIFAAAGVGERPVGAYCGSGVAAAVAVLALEVAGFGGAALYVGSWSDWITDPARPVAVGTDEGQPA